MNTSRYSIVISYSEQDQGFLADIPDLQHCTAFGHTHREALEELERALAAWLQAARREKKPIPEPRLGFAGAEM